MAITIADFLGTRDGRQPTASACSCPACSLLNCLQRPRFFAGQLISETDLNSQVDYILAKQRLHNRYLHGSGTVCGLEVLCNSCDGYVTVTPGYAIAPCGDDIIVCQQQSFDVLGAIKACCNASRNKTNCDPYRPATDPGCTGLEEKWCITIKYLETPTQAVTPLRNPPSTSTCGCGNGCGCCNSNGTNGKKTGSACGCSGTSPVTSTAATPVQCEPTRVLEGFQLGVIPDPGNCDTAGTLLGNTLFAKLLQCLSVFTSYATKLPASSLAVIQAAVAGTLANSQTPNATAYTACCQFRQALLNTFNASAGVTDCAEVAALQAASCPAPTAQQAAGTDAGYLQVVQDTISQMIQMLFLALRECICHNLLPPCPQDPMDDRLILACVTIKDGQITEICNFSCRQFAGAFPSFFYWLSAVPIVPIIRGLIDQICCATADVKQDPVRGDRAVLVKQAAVTPFQQAFMDSNFAMPRSFVQHLGDVAQKMTLSNLVSSVTPGQLNIATLNGMSAKDATAALGAHNVTFEQVQVSSRSDIPLSAKAFVPLATAGDHVVLYVSGGNVIDAQSSPAAQAAAQPGAAAAQVDPREVADLRDQVKSLRADLEKLRARVKPANP